MKVNISYEAWGICSHGIGTWVFRNHVHNSVIFCYSIFQLTGLAPVTSAINTAKYTSL